MVTESTFLPILSIIVLSYLIGSIPTAYLIGRLQNVNIFEMGSGNMGGTNVARIFGIGWGVATIVLDSLKGAAAVALSILIMPSAKWTAFSISAIVVICGHNWSLFATLISTAANQGRLTIRGGKGGATYFGTLLMLAPAPVIFGMLAFGGFLVLVTRFVSLGVLSAFVVAGVWLAVLMAQGTVPNAMFPYLVTANALVFWRFRENIQRLLAGKERRLGDRVKTPA
jgi:glycerol-3-phosphate acyltransferase PlsY